VRRPVDLARDCLAGVTAPRIAVVTRKDRPGLVDRLVATCPGATVEMVDLREGMAAAHLALTAGRPVTDQHIPRTGFLLLAVGREDVDGGITLREGEEVGEVGGSERAHPGPHTGPRRTHGESLR